ncbi:MAG: SHOCT domain-containing protein [Planctomycetota bacterium]
MSKRLTPLALVLVLVFAAGGCAWSIGGSSARDDADVEAAEPDSSPLLRQLRELKRAHEDDLITDEEYVDAKRRLLENR